MNGGNFNSQLHRVHLLRDVVASREGRYGSHPLPQAVSRPRTEVMIMAVSACATLQQGSLPTSATHNFRTSVTNHLHHLVETSHEHCVCREEQGGEVNCRIEKKINDIEPGDMAEGRKNVLTFFKHFEVLNERRR